MEIIKSIRLVFTEGNSDKEYNAQIVKDGKGYVVNFQFGRRNGTLQTGTKTDEPVTLESAEKIYNKIVKEKTGKGYLPDGESKSTYTPVNSSDDSVKSESAAAAFTPQLLNPISEEELESLSLNDNIVFQPKKDGERRLVFKSGTECYGGNRKGLKVSLPTGIVDSIKDESDIALDGEIIGETLFVFDLLRHNGKDYKNETYAKRIEQLSKVKFGTNIKVVQTARTHLEKKKMLAALKSEGAEGVVAKDINSKYTSSLPNSGGPALKFKFYKTATVKVSELTKAKRSVRVSVLDNGVWVDVGAVTIPPNHNIPSVSELVEVRYLYAYKGGCLYQPTFLGKRTDLDDGDASINQLEYKQEEATA